MIKRTLKGYFNNPERQKLEVIPGTFDAVFKSVLTKNKEYLSDIVSGITSIPKEEIFEKSTIKNSEYIKENIKEKKKISDLVITVEEDVIILEMNNEYYKKLMRKNNEYIFKSSLLYEEAKIILISFNNFDKSKRIINKVMFIDEDKEVDDDSIIKYKINLVKLEEKYYNNDKLTKLEKEIMMLKLYKREDLIKISKGDYVMSDVYKTIDELSKTKEISLLYDKEEREAYIRKCMKEDGIEEGIEEGIKQERKNSKKLLEEERKNSEKLLDKEKLKIAKNLLSMNILACDVAKATGLPISEIEKLKLNK